MSFLYPAFLIGAVAIAIPIALHLLRRNVAPEVPFTAVRLLRRSPAEQTHRRRLRDLLLLTARVAALLLLAAAFARPYYTAAAEPALSIIAIDRSSSMAAPGRFDRALAEARQAIDAAGAGRVAVIAFDDRATVIAPPGGRGEARAALDAVRPGFGGTRFAAMFAKAAEISGQRLARLIVVSDLQRAGWEGEAQATVPANLHVEVRNAGPDTGNLAVINVGGSAGIVVAAIANGGGTPMTGTARVALDGRPVASAAFSVPASGTVDVAIPYRPPDHGMLTVDIDDPAGYPGDNRRFLMLDAASRTRVVIIGVEDNQSGFYLSRALQSVEGDDAFDVRIASAAAIAAIPAAELARQSAVVLLTTKSLDRRAREMLSGFVRGGGGLLVAASSDLDAAVLATMMGWSGFSAVEDAAAATMFAPTDPRHPVFRAFGPLTANLGHVRFTRAWKVRAEDGWDVAARFADGSAALLERREGRGQVLVFASDVDQRWNDFPLHAAFVPFAIEAVRHVSPFIETRRDYAVGDAPRGARAEPGVHTLADGRRITINVDPRESTTPRLDPQAFTAMVQTVPGEPGAAAERQAQQTEGQQSLWRYGLLLMVAALVAESVAGRVT